MPRTEYRVLIRHPAQGEFEAFDEDVPVRSRGNPHVPGDFEDAKRVKRQMIEIGIRRNIPGEVSIQSREIPDFRDCEHPFTGEEIRPDQKAKNASESIRWYQVLTRSCDPVMLRGRMKALGQLNETNDPKVREEPMP
jgi:hypothetical protein